MKCLVTGSSGYIGSELVRKLQSRGHDVVGLDRRKPATAGPDKFVHADLMDGVPDDAMDGVDCVLHLAAAKDDWGLTEEEYFRDNYHATERVIDAGRRHGVKEWVFYSTVSVLGSSLEPLNESAPLSPENPYGASKAKAEELFRQLSADNPDARILVIRPSAVYGPGNPPNNNIYRLIDAVHGMRFIAIGDGSALKTTSHLENLLAATFFAMDRMGPGIQTFIYVDEPVISTRELVSRVYEYLQTKEPSWSIPLWVAWPVAHVCDVLAAVLRRDLPITAARIRKFCTSTNFDSGAIRRLGFKQPVSNEDALRNTVKWYLAHQKVGHETLLPQRPQAVRHAKKGNRDPLHATRS